MAADSSRAAAACSGRPARRAASACRANISARSGLRLTSTCGRSRATARARACSASAGRPSANEAAPVSAPVSAPHLQLELLTPRERDVLGGVARGLTNKAIAAELGISRRTVEAHRESLMRKLEIHSVAGLTRFALEAGLMPDA